MSAVAEATTATAPRWHRTPEALRATWYLGIREVRTVLRQPAAFIPNLIMPIFFFAVMVGALSGFAERFGVSNYRGFQLPVSIMFAVTGGSAGLNMVNDIESGYFDKLLLTPASRVAILIGAMSADFVRIVAQGLLVAGLALAFGTHFATGVVGMIAMVLIAGLWGLAYSAIGFAVALKTGSNQATQSTWVLFMPMMFLTTAFAPQQALSGWLATAADYNPMTYLLRGLRALAMTGWDGGEIAVALLAVACTGVVTMTFAFRALVGRIR